MLKKFCAILMCSLALVGTVTTAFAAEPDTTPVDVQLDYASAKDNANGTTTYELLNPDEIAELYGIENPKAVTITIFNREPTIVAAPRSISIANIIGPNQACGVKEITRNTAINSYDKPIDKVITLTGTVENTYSTSVEAGVDVEVASISAAVGFDVTESWSMSDSTEVRLEPGESITVYAYPLYDSYNFDIIDDPWFGEPTRIGFGNAAQCMGFCTIAS